MKYVILAILGLIILNGLLVLHRVGKCDRRANKEKLKYPNRINLWR